LRPGVAQKFRLRRIVIISSCFLLVFGSCLYFFMFSNVQSVLAGTSYTWNGSISSDWNTPGNWTPNAVPDSVDIITIGAATRPLNLTSEVKITNLICNNSASIDLNGFYLTLLGSFTFNSGATIELHGGNFNILGNATFNGGIISDFDSLGLINTTGSSCVFGNSAGGPTLNASLNVSALNVTMRSTTFNRDLVILKRGSGNDNSYGNNTFNGNTTFINNGSGNILLANNVKDVFNKVVTFSNSGTAAIYPAYNDVSGTLFNDSIYVNSVSGNGVLFSGGSGTSTLGVNSNIVVGDLGFSAGTLSLRHFNQTSSYDLALPLGTNSVLSFGPTSIINGTVFGQAGGIVLNGATFSNKVSLVKTGVGNNAGTGGNIFTDSVEVTNSGSGYLLTGNSMPDVFHSATMINNSGTSDIYLCHSSAGNIFNGTVQLLNSGTGASNRIFICEGNATASATFNDSLTVNNISNATSAYLRFNLRGTCTFNSNIIVNSTGGTGTSSNGIYFGGSGYNGTASLADGKHILIGNIGFSKGVLSLIKFNKTGLESDSILMGMNSSLVFGPNLVWNGKLTATTGGVSFNGARFSDDVSITKIGSASETSTGGNTFMKEFSLANNGAGNIVMGNTLPDVFNDKADFTNSGTAYLQLANSSAGNVFNGKVNFLLNGNGNDNRILVADGNASSSAVFNDDVVVINTATATTSLVRFNLRGTCTFNGNIILSNTSGPANRNNGVYFSWSGYSGSASQAAGKNISFGDLGFVNGNLQLIRFTQNGNADDSLMMGNTASLTLGPASRFGGNFVSSSGNLFLNGCQFDSTSILKKVGPGNDNGAGGNIFTDKAIISNAGTGHLLLGNSAPDIFSNGLELNNSGTSHIYIGHNSSGNQYFGDVTFNNAGTGTDTRILIGEGNTLATNVFNGNVLVNNLSTSTDGLIRFNLRGRTEFNENIIVNSTVGSGSNGVDFGWPGYSGSASLALGKTITVGSSGFSKGTLLFQNFNQLGDTTQYFHLTGTAILTFGGNSIFGGTVVATSPELYFNGTTFNGTVYGEKTSNNNNSCLGNNVFNQNTEIVNGGSGSWTFSNTNKDIYNGNLSVKNVSTGIIYLANNDATGTQFNGNLVLANSSTGSIRFGQGTGTAILSNGNTISFGPTGFANGTLYLRNFNQAGTTPQSLLIPTGTAGIYFQTGTTFNGPLDVSSPQLFLNGSTFYGTSSFVKNGATNNSSNGGNVFHGNVTIRTSGAGNFILANNSPDNFNANVVFKQNGYGILYPAYNWMNNFRGDISTVGSDTLITFAAGSGTVNFSGSGPQSFYGDALKSPRVRRMSMNNSSTGLTLNIPISIYSSLALINGNISTTSTNLLTIENGVSSISSVSDNSFVNGPMRKIGNQAFTFPVGKNDRYRPIAITSPGSNTDQYTAEYFYADPDLLHSVSNMDVSLNNISRCEYWTLSKVGGASNPFVALSWNTNSCGVSTVSDLRVVRWNALANKWSDMGNGSATGSATAGTVLASSNSSIFNVYTLGSIGSSNVLPIELSSFNAKYENNIVHVWWETMSEINNDYFTIERSTDGFSFEKVGIVQGAGNSTIQNDYTFDDVNPYSGVSFYRLIQTDYNGKFEVFDPVSVKSKGAIVDFEVLSVAPNPFSDQLKVQYSIQEEANLVFELYSLSGSLIVHKDVQTSQGSATFEFDQITDIPSGVYIIKILSEGAVLYSNKVIKN